MTPPPTALDPGARAQLSLGDSARSSTAPALVRRELLRALGDLVLMPPRALVYSLRRPRLREEVSTLLGAGADLSALPAPRPLPARPLRLLVSCAEVSGEIHARSLVQALRARIAKLGGPPPAFVGLGGPRLEAEGVRLIGSPVERARMGVRGVSKNLPYYLDLLREYARELERDPPDVFVPVDSPALHVPMAHIAHRLGIPVVHFVTPQYWGWAPWRVRGYREAVDRALTILPFEAEWFRRRGVRAVHVGHPLLDALTGVPRGESGESADADAVQRETRKSDLVVASNAGRNEPRGTSIESKRELVLLPGSRDSVIEQNLAWMLDAAQRLRARVGDIPVVVLHERAELAEKLAGTVRAHGCDGWVRVEARDLHATLARARAALTVSGTVLIDLLHHRLPAVVIYRVSKLAAWLSRHALTVPWFSSVNLLAGREVYPEFCFAGDGPTTDIDAALARAWGDREWRAECARGLETAAQRLGSPGAADRAALHVLDVALSSASGS